MTAVLRGMGLEPPIDARWWLRVMAWLCIVVFVVLGVVSLEQHNSDRVAWLFLAGSLVFSGLAWLVTRPADNSSAMQVDNDRWLGAAFAVIGVAVAVEQLPGAPIVYAATFVLGWVAVLCVAARLLRWRWPTSARRG
jgi:quinol-cytochrome oxidoreductase complex cytochrome b subunit